MFHTARSANDHLQRLQRLEKKWDTKLRPMLMGLALLNSLFLILSGGEQQFGLIPVLISFLVNALLLIYRDVTTNVWLRFLVDTTFTVGLLVWFIVCNVLLSDAGWRGEAGVIVGTWSTMVTLVMFFIFLAFTLRSTVEIIFGLQESSPDTWRVHNETGDCSQCQHCGSKAGMTVRDRSIDLANGFAQWAVEQMYEDDPEDGKVRLASSPRQYATFNSQSVNGQAQAAPRRAHDEGADV